MADARLGHPAVWGIVGRGESMGVAGSTEMGGTYSWLVPPRAGGLELLVEGCSPVAAGVWPEDMDFSLPAIVPKLIRA